MSGKAIIIPVGLILGILGLGLVVARNPRLRETLADRSLSGTHSGHVHDQDHSDPHQHGTDGHVHGADTGPEAMQVTVWSDCFEVFLEHPPLVARIPAEFVVHVTDLRTGLARDAGPVTFALQGDAGDIIKHAEAAPVTAGIYLPELRFPEPGRWRISLLIPHEGTDYVVELPVFNVYGSAAEAAQVAVPERPQGINVLKEQQWQVPVKVERPQRRGIAGQHGLAIPTSAVVDQADNAVVFVQAAGETFQRRYPELGDPDAGYVHVLAGVSQDDYVATRGALAIAAAGLTEVDAHSHEDDPHSQAVLPEHDHEPGVIHLDEQRMAELGIELAPVGPGEVQGSVNLPGEIKLNTDRVAHIVPQVSGIARQVLATVGDRVEEGEVLAWLESAKLGETKVRYLAKLAEISCCSLELTRAQQVNDNTIRLLTELESRPSLDVLRDTDGAPMGKNLSQLVSAYAEWVLTQKTYLREKGLFEKQITSRGEFLEAENAFKKAEAVYNATRDSVMYDVQHDLLEAQRVQRVGQVELASAERSLYVLGLTAAEMHRLAQMDQAGHSVSLGDDCDDPNCPHCRPPAQKGPATSSGETVCDCGDANCQQCVEHVHEEPAATPGETGTYEQRLAWYPLRAPFAGTVIRKHLSTGEFVKGDSEVFVIANLDTVWVDFQVHQKDLSLVREGQTMAMQIGAGLGRAEGRITYVSSIVDVATRTAWARVVLPNPDRRFRPGLFVTGAIAVDRRQTPLVVTGLAVQYIEDQPCVFVYEDGHWHKRDVELGRADNERMEILSGLQRGEIVAADGSFHIKAEIERQSTGAGGHGHAH